MIEKPDQCWKVMAQNTCHVSRVLTPLGLLNRKNLKVGVVCSSCDPSYSSHLPPFLFGNS